MALLTASACILAFSTPIRAELPPSVYEELQKDAPEVLEIEVATVALNSRDGEDLRTISVFATAVVKKVSRSRSGTKVGDQISLRYLTFEVIKPGWVGPSAIAEVQKGKKYRVWLKKSGAHFYEAARGWTVQAL
ncbi:MAG TPA: hypothetical protein VF681_03975 [Abditibacteriaceae bacterium]